MRSYEIVARAFGKDLGPEVMAGLAPNAVELLRRHEEVLHEVLEITPDNRNPEKINPNSRDLFKSYLNRLGLKVDSQFLLQISKEDEFEIWTTDMKFIGCSHGFMRACSYSFKELAETDWAELFRRDPVNQQKLVDAIIKMKQGQSYVPDVTDWHVVEEIAAKKVSIMIRVKATALAFDAATGMPQAIVGVTQIKRSAGARPLERILEFLKS